MASRPDFDKIARGYRWLEYATLGGALERCRFHFLPELRDRKCALVLGDGDGRFLARLLAGNPSLHTDAVDSSGAMLKLLRARCTAVAPGGECRLKSYHSDALDFLATTSPALPYDLVATHFFMDCLTQAEVKALVAGVASRLSAGAVWVVSEFRIPEDRMRLPARLLVGSLYLAFRIVTGLRTRHLPDHASALVESGFVCIRHREFLGGVLISELWHFTEAHSRP